MPLFNRPLLVVSIGFLNILTYTVVCGVLLINLKYYEYSEYDYHDHKDVYDSYRLRREAQIQREIYGSFYSAMCVVMAMLSGLLIWGVVEKRPSYIAPWLLASFIVLIYSVVVVLEDVYVKSAFRNVANLSEFFAVLFVGFVIQLFCLVLVYTLYKDIELEIFIKRHYRGNEDQPVPEPEPEPEYEEAQQNEEDVLNTSAKSNTKFKPKAKSKPKRKGSRKAK